MAHRSYYKPVLFFMVKTALLAGIYYYFSEQIHFFAYAADTPLAVAYAGGFAALVLLLLISFRWSGLVSRILAGLIALAMLCAIIVLYIKNRGLLNIGFIISYIAIVLSAAVIGHIILFRKRKAS